MIENRANDLMLCDDEYDFGMICGLLYAHMHFLGEYLLFISQKVKF